jgi:hypothetical protein
VADLATLAGFTPDLEQRDALDVIFGFTGQKVTARDVAIVCPRQNMKTGLLKMCALGWLFITEDRLTVWSAHEFGTALEAFRDMCQLIESTPDLEREVGHIHRTSGAEAIEMRDGRRLRFKARTKGGGRGLTGNRIVLDEAMYLKADHMGALVPTLRAVPDPQLVYAGSAGMLASDVWRSVRDRGRAGGDTSLAYLEWADADEWSCPDGCTHAVGSGCAMDDEARWWRSNPALGGRIHIESLRADRRTLPPIEFARETLGWWEDPPTDGADDALASWPDRADPTASPAAPLMWGVDVSPNMASAAIGVCGSTPAGECVELVDHRRGSAWVPARVAELAAKHGPMTVGVVKGSPAEALIPDLDPLDGVTVKALTAADTTTACATFARGVTDGTVAHRDDPRLNDAVAGARRKFAGDGWRWTRVGSDTDISPLYAVSVARHLWATTEEYDPLGNLW